MTGPIKVSTGALRFGGNNTWNDEWFAGSIDELRVYNRALTATEIQADMARPVSAGYGGCRAPPPPRPAQPTSAARGSVKVPFVGLRPARGGTFVRAR